MPTERPLLANDALRVAVEFLVQLREDRLTEAK